MHSAPWTEVGRLESEMRDVKNQLSQTAKSYELNQIRSDISTITNNINNIIDTHNQLYYEVEMLREELRILNAEV